MRSLILFALCGMHLFCAAQNGRLRTTATEISFGSVAPLETIRATNVKATGLIDPADRTFAVRIPVAEFVGFNSPLQREHFNENYLVTSKWPTASFQGRIIEAVDLSRAGNYSARAKGSLTVRGVTRERIIPVRITVDGSGVHITSTFDVVLDEHGIRIPRVVQQKIAAVVQVKAALHFGAEAGDK